MRGELTDLNGVHADINDHRTGLDPIPPDQVGNTYSYDHNVGPSGDFCRIGRVRMHNSHCGVLPLHEFTYQISLSSHSKNRLHI